MPQITVTLVDRTGAAASASHENFKMGIMQELVKILDDLIHSDSEYLRLSMHFWQPWPRATLLTNVNQI